MENNQELKLQKTRSIAAIVRDGYRLYTGHFRRMVKASWLMAIVYGLAFAWVVSQLTYHVLPLIVANHNGMQPDLTQQTATVLWMAMSTLAFLLSALLLALYALQACNEHRQTNAMSPVIHWWGTSPSPKSIRLLGKALHWTFTCGLRHVGTLMGTIAITAIITLLLTFFCELPGFIIGTANVKAYSGLAMGDPLGMPSYLPTLTFIALTVAGFIQAYVHLGTLFPLYYAYGSIETHEQERKQFNP